MISKSTLAAAIVATIGVFTLPAAFGEFPARKTPPVHKTSATREAPVVTASAASNDGQARLEPGMSNRDYEYAGGDAGWVLKPAQYVFEDGALVHAKDCPFRVASAK